MDVHPAIALGSVFVGVALFGPIGALIGIPLAAMVLAIFETYGQRYELLPELQARTRGEKPAKKGDTYSGDAALVVPAGRVNDILDRDADGDTAEAFSEATTELRDHEPPHE
jgi:hypothetical protein